MEKEVTFAHFDMINKLSGFLHHNTDGWRLFQNMLNVYLRPAEVKDVNDMGDVCMKLMEKKIISYGQYDELIEIFNSIEHVKCVEIVEEFVTRIHEIKERHKTDNINANLTISHTQPYRPDPGPLYQAIMDIYNSGLQSILVLPANERLKSLKELNDEHERSLRLIDKMVGNCRDKGLQPGLLTQGSLLLSFTYGSRQSLLKFWNMYRSGELLDILQAGLITPYVLVQCQMEYIQLQVVVSEEEYRERLAATESLQSISNPTEQPALQSRTEKSTVEYQGANAGRSTEVRVRHGDELEYNMSHGRLGKAVVISNTRFQSGVTHLNKSRSDVDAAKIFQHFEELGFDVEILFEKTRKQILEKFRRIAKMDHSDNDCFFCAIISHGDADRIWATDRTVDLEKIMRTLNSSNCPSLRGKPKVFFIQMAEVRDREVYVKDALWERARSTEVTIPHEEDFLICRSSIDGTHSELGASFFNTLCQELDKLTESGEGINIIDLLNKVNKVVVIDIQSCLRKALKIGKTK